MKVYTRLFLLGGFLLTLALVFAACSANTPEPAPVIEELTNAPTAAPSAAPAGERAKRYDLFAPMFDGQFCYGLTIFRGDDLTTITVPEIFESKSGAHVVVRGASIQLIALLQSGDLDYAFEYESVIAQHDLQIKENK